MKSYSVRIIAGLLPILSLACLLAACGESSPTPTTVPVSTATATTGEQPTAEPSPEAATPTSGTNMTFTFVWKTTSNLSGLTGIALDKQCNIYVCEHSASTVHKLDASSNELAKWGEAGSGDGQFG